MGDDEDLFTNRDFRLFRITAILAAWVALAGLIILIFWIFSRVLSHFYTLLLPLAVAGVLALVLDPVVRLFQRRLGLDRLPAIIMMSVILLGLIAGVFLLVIPEMLAQARELGEVAPELLGRLHDSLAGRFPRVTEHVTEQLESLELAQWAPDVDTVVDKVTLYAGLLVGLGFVPLFLFFMLMAGRNMQDNARELISMFSNKTQEEIIYLTRTFIDYVTAFFQGQLIIAIIIGVMLASGFTLIGLQAAIILGLLLGLLNIVPFLGTIVGLALALPIAWLQPEGGLELVGLTLGVFVIVQIIESWVLTPRIMSEKSGLHPAIVVISLFFWGIVFGGVIGMILAVPLSAFLVSLWWHVKRNHFSSVVTDQEMIERTNAQAGEPAGIRPAED